MNKTIELIVSGRVQGVGFRYFVSGEACRLGIHGYVENLPAGQVRVVVHGELLILEKLTAACRRGPSASQVDQVERRVTEEEVREGFFIKR